jgi:RND family efflux transporter MFP subunit
MARAKVLGRSRLALAQTAVDAKKAILETEQAQARDIEQQIQACRLVAPQDGIVVYFVPEGTRVNDGSMVIAQGELVREGQKVIQVPDLTQMLVSVRVPEALVSNLRSEDPKDKNGPQAARIRMDALPNRVFKGHVKVVDTVAEETSIHDPRFGDIYYRTLVSIDEKPDGLNPFMSAEVTIDTGGAAGVLQVPLLAVVRAGHKEYCYVKRGKEIHKTAVTPGLRSDARVEIRSGLKEGDEVLRDPVGLLRRLK